MKRKRNIRKKKQMINKGLIVFNAFLFIVIICLCVYIVNLKKPVEIQKEETIVLNDENYVLLGDSITEQYPVSDFFSSDTPIVNSGFSGYKTTDLLEILDQSVYKYNPSAVFIQIGTNDLYDGQVDEDDIYNNIIKITKNIKKNRPYTKIYIESIYPINNEENDKINMHMVGSRNNKDIVDINEKLKDYCEESDVEYIDVYSELSDNKGDLKLDYTIEGLHLTNEGYSVVTNILKNYIIER